MKIINEKQKEVLDQIDRDTKIEKTNWVNVAGIDLRLIRALERAHLVAFNRVDGKRLARVTMAGWKYLGKEIPGFIAGPRPDAAPVGAKDDVLPMESEVPHLSRHGPIRMGPFPKQAIPPAPAPPPGDAEGREEKKKARAWAEVDEMLAVVDGHEGEGNECAGCVFREIVELLRAKDPLYDDLVAVMLRARAIRDDLGI